MEVWVFVCKRGGQGWRTPGEDRCGGLGVTAHGGIESQNHLGQK